ncbi:MAG: hypothetical protein Tsb0020_25470 [Haliangiales bacterium]
MRPGDVIAERFEIEREVATGGMGRIYRARDRQQGTPVAVKLLTQPSRRLRSRLLKEAAILAEIHHPGIVRYIAHGPLAGDMVYLVMEWLEGEDLSKFLGRRQQPAPTRASSQTPTDNSDSDLVGSSEVTGATMTLQYDSTTGPAPWLGGPRVDPLPIADAITLGRRLSTAVAELHRRGIVHRDIKPSNLFLPNGALEQVKLLDFGTAYQSGGTDRLTRRDALVGTPHYMAPEQARSGGSITPATDVWAIGCVLYRCLTGARPFEGNDVLAVLTRILLDRPAPVTVLRADVPPAFADLVMQTLEKDAAARLPDASAVLSALDLLDNTDENQPAEQRVSRRPAPAALTAIESRVTCMLFADFSPAAPPTDELLTTITRPIGGQAQTLADGTVVVTIPDVRLPGDQAARAARVALALRCEYPNLRLVLATGRAMRSPTQRETAMRVDVDAALESLHQAEPSRILLDATTTAALESRFMIVREDGQRYLGPERDHEAARTLLGKPTRWIGRRIELAMLVATFEECAEERISRAVLVTAPAGMGKSRLREELVRTLRKRGEDFLLISGCGDAIHAGSPLVMLAPALRRLAGILDGEDAELAYRKLHARIAETLSGDTLSRVLPFLGEMIGLPLPASDSDDDVMHAARRDPAFLNERMKDAWQTFLRAECARQPVLIVLDDMHWGDMPSVDYVDVALEALRARPLMVLALARPEVRTLFPQLWSRRDILDVPLAPLPPRAGANMVREALGESVGEDIVEHIVTRAGGNAFFIEELIRAVAEAGPHEVPETVLGIVQARLDALGPEAKRILRAAAIFGETFWQDGVETLLGPGGAFDVGAWLDELAAREIIRRVSRARLAGQSEYRFRHALLCDAAYAMLTEEDRRLGHGLAGDWLERANDPNGIALAEHFLRGGQLDRALPHFCLSAEQALREGEYEVAIERSQRAIDAGARGPQLGQLRAMQAVACFWSYRYHDCLRLGRDACGFVAVGSVTWYRAIGYAIAAAYLCDDYATARPLCAALIAAPCDADTEAEKLVCVCRAGYQMILRGLIDEAAPFVHEAITADEKQLPMAPRTAAQVSSVRALAAAQQGDLSAARDFLERAIDAFEQAGDVPNAILERNTLSAFEIELGRYDRAVNLAQHNLSLLRAGTNRVGYHFARITLGYCMGLERLRRNEGREILTASIEAYRKLQRPPLEGFGLIRLAAIDYLDSRFDDAERHAARAVVCLEPSPSVLSWALAMHARALMALERRSESLIQAKRSMRLHRQQGGLIFGASLPPLALGQALMAHGAADDAARAATEALAYLDLRAASLLDSGARQSFLATPENIATYRMAEAATTLESVKPVDAVEPVSAGDALDAHLGRASDGERLT